MRATTLARKLGDITHVSPLLRKVTRLSGCAPEQVPVWLLKCAVQRGATHYQRDFDPQLPSDHAGLSDEELGIALCLGEHPYDLTLLRAAAQLLSTPRIDASRLVRLAEQERCEPVLRHIAETAARFAPELEPWSFVRASLRTRNVPRTEALPHWTRLVSHTGVTPFSGPADTKWLCRCE